MRIVLVAISLSLLLFVTTTGCYTTYNPVTSMSNYDLQNEFNSLQTEQLRLQRMLTYGGTGYTTTHSAGTIFTNPTSHVTPNTYTVDQLAEVERRMQEIEYEVSRRKQMGYLTSTFQKGYSNTTKSSSGKVYSTKYSRLFHRSGCSKLKSKDGDLMVFSSNEGAKKDGGTPCSECNP